MERLDICAIIVTYNRKVLLARCLQAVEKQSYPLKSIIIIDNASSDNTFEYLCDNDLVTRTIVVCESLLDVSIGENNIFYYRLNHNMGGAGGFYTGMKLAHKIGYDAYWLMDDDGYPSEDCLERQIGYIKKYDYVMPVSLDVENPDSLSWPTKKRNNDKTVKYAELMSEWGEIMPYVFPFNGCLLSAKIVDEVGYINPKLFIWGDDYEHYYRCLKHKYNPITLLTAKFYHPANRGYAEPIFFGLVKVPFVKDKLRFVCVIRNWAYINKTNGRYGALVKSFFAYSWLFLITRRLDMEWYKLYLASWYDGIRGIFTRHLQYIK